ncbi:MAG: DUF3140 domain-containing protein [Saprospiraceae bacterium]
MADHTHDETYTEFNDTVNMAPAELEKWLKTDESKSVGDTSSADSTGHQSGEKIVKIKHKNKADLTDDDYAHMRKTIGYIHRHRAQRPDGDVSETRWAYSLKNWGFDPTK